MPDYMMEDDEPEAPAPLPAPTRRRGLKRKLGLADYIFMAINPEAGKLLDRITSQQRKDDEFDYRRQKDEEDRGIRRGNLRRLESEDAAQRKDKEDARRKELFGIEQDVVKSGGHKIKDMADLFTPREETVISRGEGEAYAVPTQPMLAKREIEKKKSEAQQALEAKIAEERTLNPIKTQGKVAERAALLPGELIETREKAKIQAEFAPDRIVETTDDDGNVRITGVPRKVSGTTDLGKVGKSKGKSEDEGDISSQGERTLRETQDAIDAVKTPRADDMRSDEERFQAALNAVKLAVAARPNELEGGVDKASGWPYIKPKTRAAGKATGSNSKDPRIGKTATRKDGTRVRVTGIDSAGDPITEELPKIVK